jgi:hypothetical protein
MVISSEEEEMDGTCSTHRRSWKFVQNFNQKLERNITLENITWV